MSRFALDTLTIGGMEKLAFTPAREAGKPTVLQFSTAGNRFHATFLPKSISLGMLVPRLYDPRFEPGEPGNIYIVDRISLIGNLSYPQTVLMPAKLLRDERNAASIVAEAIGLAIGDPARRRYRLLVNFCTLISGLTGAGKCSISMMNSKAHLLLSTAGNPSWMKHVFHPAGDFINMKSAMRHLRCMRTGEKLETYRDIEGSYGCPSGHEQMKMISAVAEGFDVDSDYLVGRIQDLRQAFERAIASPANNHPGTLPDSVAF